MTRRGRPRGAVVGRRRTSGKATHGVDQDENTRQRPDKDDQFLDGSALVVADHRSQPSMLLSPTRASKKSACRVPSPASCSRT